MLRSDTTALFERLREANILLQEVLSGAHENMSEIESTLVTRVADFVSAMNEVAQKTGTANSEVERNITAFHTITAQTHLGSHPARHPVRRARPLAGRGGRADRHEQPAHRGGGRRAAQRARSSWSRRSTSKSDDLEQRLKRFSSLLDQSLEGATERAREIARLVADATTGGARAHCRELRVDPQQCRG